MAVNEATGGWTDGGLSCYFHDAHATTHSYLDDVRWGRDTGNCEQSKLGITMNSMLHYDSLVWASHSNPNFGGNDIKTWTNIDTKQHGEVGLPKGGGGCPSGAGCCFCHCGGWDCYWHDTHGHWNFDILGNKDTTWVRHQSCFLNEWTGVGTYNLPNDRRVLPPTGISTSFPTNFLGSVTSSISSWSSNSNIGGTPTSYPNAKYWNVAIDLLDQSGNYLAHQCRQVGETKSVTFSDIKSGFYTASALSGTAAANSSKYTLQGGKKYKLRVIWNNNMNQQVSSTSGLILFDIPTPVVNITSFVYDSTNPGHAKLTFSWSKAVSGADEKITYKITQSGGNTVTGTLVASTGGAAKSGTKTVTLNSGEYTTVTVTNTMVADTSMTKSASKSQYAPVDNAAFIGYVWDELRHIVTVTATAKGAANTRLYAGYSSGVYDISNTLTPGTTGTITISNPNHGTGQKIYLKAVPEASNGYQYNDKAANLTIAIPNPIIGLKTPDPDMAGSIKEYIVDVVEKKTDGTVTPKWQNTWPRFKKKP